MKTILQKHTSKFVANLLNGLGIVACVSLTACGDESKDKQTDNLVDKLKNKKFYQGLVNDEAKLKKIAEWLNENGKDENYNVTNEDLDEIFSGSNSGVRVGDKKLVEVPKGTTSSPGVAAFGSKGNKLEKKEQVSLKIEGKGKVSIVKGDTIEKSFTFNTIEDLQDFVKALKNKEVTGIDEKWSLEFEGENVKICGHETGFGITGCFGVFFDCLNTLVGFKKLNIPNLSLKIEGDKLSLNGLDCTDDYFKKIEFWNLVKDNATIFGITDTNKFKIEKEGADSGATVKIDKFETSLNWSNVCKNGKEFVDDSGWNRIFELESKGGAEKDKETEKKTFKWGGDGKYSLNEGEGVEITLENLKSLVETLSMGSYSLGNDGKNFSLKFDGKNVKICDGKNIDFTESENFEGLIGCIASLNEKGVLGSRFVINIAISSNDILLNGNKIDNEFIKKNEFWNVIKNNVTLFESLPFLTGFNIKSQGNVCMIGSTETEVVISKDSKKVEDDWVKVFKLSE